MAVYVEGQSTTPGTRVDPSKLQTNREYIFEYKAPAIAFSLISPETMSGVIRGWLRLRNEVASTDPGAHNIVTLTGVEVDSGTGVVRIRGRVETIPEKYLTGPDGKKYPLGEVQTAGVNVKAIVAVAAGLFAALGVGLTLMFVYEVAGSAEGGITGAIRNTLSKAGWAATGVAVGAFVVLAVVFFFVVIRPSRA